MAKFFVDGSTKRLFNRPSVNDSIMQRVVCYSQQRCPLAMEDQANASPVRYLSIFSRVWNCSRSDATWFRQVRRAYQAARATGSSSASADRTASG